MRKYVIAGLLAIGTLSIQAQNTSEGVTKVAEGDMLEIAAPSGSIYDHIKFPRANFIIKKGGIADYKSMAGEEVVVTKVRKTKDGDTKIDVKRKDGKRFFNTSSSVTVLFEDALSAGEIRMK